MGEKNNNALMKHKNGFAHKNLKDVNLKERLISFKTSGYNFLSNELHLNKIHRKITDF